MYLSIDIGGTKTLIAVFRSDGVVVKEHKFPTNHNYSQFIIDLLRETKKIWLPKIVGVGVAVPGKINRKTDEIIAFGNIPWKNVDIVGVLEKEFKTKVFIENDANLAGLAEAHTSTGKKYSKVLYVTISTGIGTGFIVDGVIDPLLADSEGGHMIFERNGKFEDWEDFASGKAIKESYGKFAYEIHDEKTWKEIAKNLGLGFQHLIAILQPDLIVIGGSIGTHLEKFDKYLEKSLEAMLEKLSDGLLVLPKIVKAKHPQEAVIYGCYLLAKSKQSK